MPHRAFKVCILPVEFDLMKAIMITGVFGNLGRAVAKAFLDQGYVVHGLERNIDDPPLSHEHLHLHHIDLMNEESTAQTIAQLNPQPVGAICLVGGFAMDSFEDTPMQVVQKMMDLNLKTAYHVAHALFPMLKTQGGKFVFVSSKPALEQGGSFATAYSLSKATLIKLTEIINEEGAEHKISAHAIAPEVIDTPVNRDSMPDANFDSWVKPEEIASSLVHIYGDLTAITQPVLRFYNKG